MLVKLREENTRLKEENRGMKEIVVELQKRLHQQLRVFVSMGKNVKLVGDKNLGSQGEMGNQGVYIKDPGERTSVNARVGRYREDFGKLLEDIRKGEGEGRRRHSLE